MDYINNEKSKTHWRNKTGTTRADSTGLNISGAAGGQSVYYLRMVL